MKIVRSLSIALAGTFPVMTTASEITVINADIIISGGSFGAPAAALAAARENPNAQILLIEPTDWLGGQSTSQGVSAIDNAWHQPAQALMANQPEKYYPADYLEFLNRMRDKSTSAPGEGMSPEGTSWVSRESFDPRTGAWVLDQMIAAHPNIQLLKMTVVKDTQTRVMKDELGDAKVISGLQLIQRKPKPGYVPFTKFLSEELPDWFSPAESADFNKQTYKVQPADAARGMVVVDASETGDAIVLAGADYVVGREKTTETVAADGTLPEHNESASQATVFPFCMTDAKTTSAEEELQKPWPEFDEFYKERKANYFSLGKWSWERVWSYRRLKTTGEPVQFDSAFRGDVTMQNWYPGNDYPDKSIYLTKSGAAAQLDDWQGGLDYDAIAGAEKIAIAFYFYMKERNTQDWDTRYLHGNDPLNMMGTPHGLARFPYIRCGRRIIGLQNFRVLQRELRPAVTGDNAWTSFRYYDSVGIGNYALDSHAVKGSDGVTTTVEEKLAPFYIPYRSIASSNVRNLLSGCKSFAGTYWTNSAYRLHPIEWATGSAAGVAAAMMHDGGKTNADLLQLEQLRQLQKRVAKNSPIHWEKFDKEPVPPQDGDLVINDLKPVEADKKFPVQIYCYGATRAEVTINGEKAGETGIQVNDHLLFEANSAPQESVTVEVKCYNSKGSFLATFAAKSEPRLRANSH